MAYVNGKKILTKVINKGGSGVDGVSENENRILIETPKDKPITIIGDHDQINITNGTNNLNINAHTTIKISDNSKENLITAANLEASNIKSGVDILGVTGTYEGGGTPLKAILDNTKQGKYLLNYYNGTDLSEFLSYDDTENVEYFDSAFSSCFFITTTPRINTDKGVSFKSTFYGCERLIKIDISKFTTEFASSADSFCRRCYNLKALIIRSFGSTYSINDTAFYECFWLKGEVRENNPNGEYGYVYVPRDMIATLQSANNWSVLQFRALEDYTKDGTTTGEFDDEKAGLV